MQFIHADNFDEWRDAARRLLLQQVAPSEIRWDSGEKQPSLFEPEPTDDQAPNFRLNVPKAFIDVAQIVACHRDARRWALLYRTLWRIFHGERHLLQISTDDDVYELLKMKKSVTRDVHKMKAFVRFRKVVAAEDASSVPVDNYIAWHRPDHRIVRLAAPFFARRFSGMNWSILTPDESVIWNQTTLQYGPGVPVSKAPDADVLEDLWKTYYASIFNPARIKIKTMKREMPVRHWATLPETALIEELLREAPARVAAMIEHHEGFSQTATDFMPSDRNDLDALRAAAQKCEACPLCQTATQTVFGAGSRNASIVIVGEQPGDQEDLAGRPFVGPAGQLLDEVMQQAGIVRRDVYVTNVVKHFKFTESTSPRGKQRLHKKPNWREVSACRPWLEAELQVVQPTVVVCMGATAAQALMGRDFRVTQDRGKVIATDWCRQTLATWHPAAILRQPDDARRGQMKQQLIEDLKAALRCQT